MHSNPQKNQALQTTIPKGGIMETASLIIDTVIEEALSVFSCGDIFAMIFFTTTRFGLTP